VDPAPGRRAFLSTLPATSTEKSLGVAVVLASLVVFLAAVPFAKYQLAPVFAFIPMYQSALVVNDLVTAVLLFGQFSILRSRAVLVLASGYLFTAVMAFAHALTFPGLFAPTGLLGAGPQTTAWLYMFWHGGFPLLVIVYSFTKQRAASNRAAPASRAVLAGIGAVVVAAGALVLLATAAHGALPPIMVGNRYTPAMATVVSTVWGLSLAALVALWRRRPHSVLDVWLMVVMCAWLFDVALSAVLNAGRFDVGFYAGRLYGLLAATFVLVVLLLENGKLYARLAELHEEVAAQNRSLEEIVRERTARLLQSEKVATMGSLLAGVAHELNNPLAVLTGHAQLLRETAEDAALVRRASKILEAADRCVRIVRSFLSLARQRTPERSSVSMNQVIAQAIELLAYELKTSDVEVIRELEPELPHVWADAHQLHQVIVNLVANAYQALRRHPQPRRIAIRTRYDAGHRCLLIEVADTGPGIPPEVQTKIFEPFFTTKPSGEGTGLGLSLCRGIIEEHGGAIDVASGTGQGTRFVITLPIVAMPSDAANGETRESVPHVSPRRVLLVDDEAELAAIVAEAISRDGHQVNIALNGAIALEMIERVAYDVIVSDTKMPQMDGEGFYAELGRRRPGLRERIIFVTGDVLSREKREFLERTGRPFLEKPCDLNELRRLVQRVADDRVPVPA
jgi:two-component system sensor histidine kinase/response regulator